MSDDLRWQRIFQHGEPFEKQTITWLNELEAAIISGGGIQSISAADATIIVGGSAFDTTLKVGLASITEAHLAFAVATQAELDTISLTPGPPGPTGPAGAAGATGPQGPAGVGVPPGGTAGQSLTKIDGTNYNTQWSTITGGGGGISSIDGSTPTTLTGLLKGNGTDIDVAVGGTDYLRPSDVDLSTKVDKDSVVVAATRIVASKLLAGDTQPAWRVFGDGKIEWGAGGSSAPDVTLTRPAGGTLQGTGEFKSLRTGSAPAFSAWVVGDISPRIAIGSSGAIDWSPGSSGNDATLARTGPGVLKATVSSMESTAELLARSGAATQVKLGSIGSSKPGIEFGSAGDTNLYRQGASILQTDDTMISTGGGATGFQYHPATAVGNAFESYIGSESYLRFYIDYSGKHQWGSGSANYDTNLYRVGAGLLQTDSLFIANRTVDTATAIVTAVAGNNRLQIRADGRLDWGPIGSLDTNLYRSAAGQLASDGGFTAGGLIQSMGGGTNRIVLGTDGVLYFNSLADVALYRAGVALLQTNGGMLAGSDFVARYGAVQQVIVGDDNAGRAGIRFGSAGDVNLYRMQANALKTSGSFVIGGVLGATLNNSNTNGVNAGWKLPVYDANLTFVGYIQIHTG